MADETGEIGWYKPRSRAIIPFDRFRVSKSLKKSAGRFEYEFDRDFMAVVDACSNREETWISPEIKAAYSKLFDDGMAHSCATYLGEELVGGVFAVTFGAAMFGESMFHSQADAGKVALWRLCQQAEKCGYELFEVQFLTPHLESLGAVEIDDDEYFPLLRLALEKSPRPLTSSAAP